MNDSEISGQWLQIKGFVKEKWGRLTEDELTQTQGKIDIIAGLVQSKYGHTKEAALKEMNEHLTKLQNDLSK